MPLSLRVTAIGFSGADEQVPTDESDLVVFIGPNNAGKSQALREIESSLTYGTGGVVVTDVSMQKEGDEADLAAWLSEVASTIDTDQGPAYLGAGGQFQFANIRATWRQPEPLHSLGWLFIHRAAAESRLHMANAVPSINIRDGHPVQPVQRLLADHALEERLSDAVQHAFGVPVSVTRAGGSELQLLLGQASSEARVDNPDYLDEVRALPAVEDQGDGMRSFIGLLLTLIATPFPIVLIDEPEAFLHPPQARELGRQLAALGNSQRFVATHDSDVLLGLLDRAESMKIVRLRREGDRNIPSVLEKDQIQELWRDPSFRYSNLLDGLFHPGVVICEADGDATLYAATLDAELQATGASSSDLLFTQCAGKQKMPVAIGALKPMGVPVTAIGDIDTLRDEGLLERIVSSLEGDWSVFRDDWRIVEQAVRQLPLDAATVGDVRAQIDESLGDDPTARLTEQQSRRVREITKSRDGWSRVRNAGVSAIPNGQAREAADRLIESLRSIGLFVVPVGALEGWAPQIGGHGPKFVDAALQAEIYRTNTELCEFVTDVARFLLSP